MKIASAQISPKDGDIDYNLNEHYKLIELAAQKGVKLIAFPEMSITGYVTESARKLCFSKDDSRINILRSLAVKHKIIIIAGAPMEIDSELYIGSFILSPDNSISIYTKQFLHHGEKEFFKPCSIYNPIIDIDNDRICLAICADINNPVHVENGRRLGCTIYIASIFYTAKAIGEAHDILCNYSKMFSMKVLMANYCGKYWGQKAGGQSALWSEDGELLNNLDSASVGLVIGF